MRSPLWDVDIATMVNLDKSQVCQRKETTNVADCGSVLGFSSFLQATIV